MKIMKITITYCVILTFVVFPPITKVEGFDSEAISQVSKGIADWKLMNEDKSKTQVERTVYVSSSLGGILEKGTHQGIGMISGLAAFANDDYSFKSNPASYPIGDLIYEMPKRTFIYGVERYVTAGYGQIGAQIYGVGTMTIGTVLQAVHTFSKTADYVGKSMQIMNPPIYLHQKTPWGWKGEGSYSIPGGYVYYQEILRTTGLGPITRTHTDWVTTNAGISIRSVVIKTPAESGMENYMIYHSPLGDYFDPYKTTMTTTTMSQRWINSPPTFNATWKTSQMGSSVIKYQAIDWNSIPKTNWSIPNTNHFPTYTPSMPSTTYYPPPNILFSTKNPISTYTTPTYRMPIYTPTMPSSPGIRRY